MSLGPHLYYDAKTTNASYAIGGLEPQKHCTTIVDTPIAMNGAKLACGSSFLRLQRISICSSPQSTVTSVPYALLDLDLIPLGN
jgi:hypothetical protein